MSVCLCAWPRPHLQADTTPAEFGLEFVELGGGPVQGAPRGLHRVLVRGDFGPERVGTRVQAFSAEIRRAHGR
jgi:hypothetical protein